LFYSGLLQIADLFVLFLRDCLVLGCIDKQNPDKLLMTNLTRRRFFREFFPGHNQTTNMDEDPYQSNLEH